MKVLILGNLNSGISIVKNLRILSETIEIVLIEKNDKISLEDSFHPQYYDRHQIVKEISDEKLLLYKIDLRSSSEVLEIDKENKKVTILDRRQGGKYFESYDKLILSPIFKDIEPILEIESNHIFFNRTLRDYKEITKFIATNKPRSVTIFGAGNMGLQLSNNMKELGIKVNLVEKSNNLLEYLDKEMIIQIENHLLQSGISIYKNEDIRFLEVKNNMIISYLKGGYSLKSDFIIFNVEKKQENSLFKNAGLQLDNLGNIIVDEYLQTSDDNIFYIGSDIKNNKMNINSIREFNIINTINKQAKIIANNILGRKEIYSNSYKVSSLRVCDLTLATTGLNEEYLISNNIPFLTTNINGLSNDVSFPNAMPLNMKLIFSIDGKILGAQAVGYKGVNKRIDIISSIIHFKGNVSDLVNIEISYNPYVNSSNDILHKLGLSAENILKGLINYISVNNVDSFINEGFILDIREEKDYKNFVALNTSYNIPLNILREKIDEVPQNKKVLIYCNDGQLSYIAYRILSENGFKDIYVLSGGLSLYHETIKNKHLLNKGFSPINDKRIDTNFSFKVLDIFIDENNPLDTIDRFVESIKGISINQYARVEIKECEISDDIKDWCQLSNYKIILQEEDNNITTFIIQKLVQNIKLKSYNLSINTNDLLKATMLFNKAYTLLSLGHQVKMRFTGKSLYILKKHRKDGNLYENIINKNTLSDIENLFEKIIQKGLDISVCRISLSMLGLSKDILLENIEISFLN